MTEFPVLESAGGKDAVDMKRARLRFTIGSLMTAVAIVAVLLALFTAWRELLPVAILVGIPLAALSGLLAYVSSQRPEWRFGIQLMMLGLVILGGGWLWSHLILRQVGRRMGPLGLDGALRADDHRFWGFQVPMVVTGICLAVYVLVLAIVCARRRRVGLAVLVMGYAYALAVDWALLVFLLDLETFVD
jgi:hypothetical protein